MTDVKVENWMEEAKSVIKDIEEHVSNIQISEDLESTDQKIYLNLTTLENNKYCIELSSSGFRVVGKNFNDKHLEDENYYETPYSLLSSISPQFHHSFGNLLSEKLNALQNQANSDI